MAEVATTILDEQEVTAAVLNDIAIDLGATSFNHFGEDKFGASELNEITKALVNPGILLSENSCKPSVENGILTIATGTIIFNSGAKIKITSPLKLTVSNSTYIYALNNTAYNKGEIVVSSSAPSGDTVMIAQISAEGTLIDKRAFSTLKVTITTPNIVKSFSCPEMTLSPYHEGRTRLRSTHTGVFEGAKYVSDAGTCFEIQRVKTTTGDELTYKQSPKAAYDNRIYAAYNLIDGVLERWVYLTGPATELYASEIWVF